MTLAQSVLALCALAYGGVGASFLLFPEPMTSLVDISLGSATADNDVRAVYGGVGLGLAAFFARSATRTDWQRPALWAALLTLGAMAFARFWSLGVVGLPGPLGFLLHGAELAGFAASVAALRRLPAP